MLKNREHGGWESSLIWLLLSHLVSDRYTSWHRFVFALLMTVTGALINERMMEKMNKQLFNI